MRATYVLSTGKEIEIFLWEDFLKNENWRGFAEVTPIYKNTRGRECKKRLYNSNKGLYIIWDGEEVYLCDYKYMPVEELCIALENHNENYVFNDTVLATFLKDTENVGIVIPMKAYDTVIPQLGFGIVGEREYEVLCVPTEHRYEKERWHYKITLECECEELRKFIPSKSYYFNDFVSFLRTGYAKLVVKDSFKEEVYRKQKEQKKNEKKFSYKIAKLFGKKTQNENLPLISC